MFWLVFPTTGAYVANTLGLIPICSAFGMTGAAKWLATPLGGLTVVLAVLAIQWCLAVFGLQYFRVAQRYVLFPFVVIGMITMIVVLALNWCTNNFRPRVQRVQRGTGITYNTVRAAAVKSGYAPAGFSLIHTLEWFVLLAGIIPFTMFAAQGMLGEVKQASTLNGFSTFLVPHIGMAFRPVASCPGSHPARRRRRLPRALRDGLRAGAVRPPTRPTSTLSWKCSPKSSVSCSILPGFIGRGFGITAVRVPERCRVIIAVSLDRTLPAFLSKVSQHFYAPMVALTVWR